MVAFESDRDGMVHDSIAQILALVVASDELGGGLTGQGQDRSDSFDMWVYRKVLVPETRRNEDRVPDGVHLAC